MKVEDVHPPNKLHIIIETFTGVLLETVVLFNGYIEEYHGFK